MRFVFSLLVACGLACAQTAVTDLLEQKMAAKVRGVDEALDGALGVAAIDLTTGRTFSYHADAVFPTASAIKIPIMIEVFRQVRAGQLRLDQEVPVTPGELVDGSLRLQVLVKKPTTLTLRDLVEAMIEVSDNSATNKLIALVGMERVNQMLDELGFPKTRLRRKMMDWAAAGRDEENVSTPAEMARLVELIYRGKVVDEAACREMLKIMKRVEADMRRAVPAKVEVAAKPGEMPGTRCEAGVIFLPKRPFALSVMSTFIRDDKDPVPDVTSLVYAYFDKLAQSNRYGHRLE